MNDLFSKLQDRKLRYDGALRQLMDENAGLRKEIRKGNKENIRLKCDLRLQTKELEECKSKKELEETSEALEDLESSYSCLMMSHLLANQELQDARKEAIQGLNDILNSKTTLGIKRMGDIDQKAFEVACSQKLPHKHWRETCAKLCSLWQQNVLDSKWHPFKMIDTDGNLQKYPPQNDVVWERVLIPETGWPSHFFLSVLSLIERDKFLSGFYLAEGSRSSAGSRLPPHFTPPATASGGRKFFFTPKRRSDHPIDGSDDRFL
ncbi:hypothetical protein F3Y22_tig00111877pilonHSYRG00233 [Hibiscus syriacus]|uniref:Factor of DNA methylation 1-5/IDN2 domain-containing protein n=1 Tax=Hibiscus syriacus TaxID=106335 RepID=A0A6A2YF74_HIBSY|nr:hypothetical protein F3Y22_tig00111877pilonHSYRG00233 [Hibiscus syriacus]